MPTLYFKYVNITFKYNLITSRDSMYGPYYWYLLIDSVRNGNLDQDRYRRNRMESKYQASRLARACERQPATFAILTPASVYNTTPICWRALSALNESDVS
jgi:hypothetical protein